MSQQPEQKWRCTICGYEAAGSEPPLDCPICGASSDKFEPVEEGPIHVPDQDAAATQADAEPVSTAGDVPPLSQYLSEWARKELEKEEKFSLIQKIAVMGKSEISPMGTRKPFPGLETILFRGAQFSRFPLDEDQPVSTKTVIGVGVNRDATEATAVESSPPDKQHATGTSARICSSTAFRKRALNSSTFAAKRSL